MTKYLIGVGAAKCGTTLLYDLLEAHPSLCKANVKELHYFDKTDAPDAQTYDAMFDGEADVMLDVTPIYMFYQECIEKICRALGAQNVKIVVLLRDPIERARSHHDMLVAQGQERLPLRECFAQEPRRMRENERGRRLYSYFSRGLYAEQLDNICRHIPHENVRVYIFEEFIADQQKVIDDVCDFAGIERIVVRDRHSNKSVINARFKWLDKAVRALSRRTPRAFKLRFLRKIKHALTRANEKPGARKSLDPDFVQELVRYYEADVEALRQTFALDVSTWRNFTTAMRDVGAEASASVGAEMPACTNPDI